MFRRRFDYELGGKGFILVRGMGSQGRAWYRTGQADTPGRRSALDVKYGELPDELDHPEVWDDWSGGCGYPYRDPGQPVYHWGENIEARFPRQITHAQMPRLLASTANVTHAGARLVVSVAGENGSEASYTQMVNSFIDGWTSGSPWINDIAIPPNLRSIYLFGKRFWTELVPRDPADGYDFELKNGWTGSTGGLWAGTPIADYGGRASVTASNIIIPVLSATHFLMLKRDGVQNVSGVGQGAAFTIAGNQLWRATGPEGGGAAKATILRVVDTRSELTATANWGANYNLGDGDAPILDMTSLDDQVYASTNRGLYAGTNTGTFYNVLGELYSQVHPDNGRDICVFDSGIVYPHISGLVHYKPSVFGGEVDFVSSKVGKIKGPLQGRFRCVRAFGGWLLAGLYTGSQSWLMVGKPGGSDWIWHTAQRLPHTTKIGRIHVDGALYASNGTLLPSRIWVATDASIDTSGTAPVYWIPYPPSDSNPLATQGGFTPNYIGSARIDLGNVDGEAPGTYKNYRSVEVWADNLLSGYRYCDLYYDLDQSGSFTLLGRAQSSPKTILYFSSGAGSHVIGQSLELSLRSFTASPAQTPIYRAIVLRSNHLPRSVDRITAVTRIADRMRDHQQNEMRSGAVQLAELRGMVGTVSTLIDIAGATQYVQVLPPIEEQEFYQVGEDEPEIMATVRMAVLSYSGG